MIRPPKLNRGDTIAAITLSWGGAGAIPHRYEAGKRQLEKTFGVKVVPTRHALKSADWIYKNPKARAEDLTEAGISLKLCNKEILSKIKSSNWEKC